MGANSGSNDAVRPEDVQSTFCAVVVDEWIRQGVVYAALAPGSRSTPLALALVRASEGNPAFTLDVFHDERSAAFAALGASLASGRPAVVLCTSGTAAAHLHAAVIEADLSAVPLIVCTADRPAELRDVGAPQTIDQIKLYGNSVRWFHDPGVPDAAVAGSWRSLAARAYWASTGDRPGPVHLNVPFREPLVGRFVPELVERVSQLGLVPTRERRRGRLELAADDLDRLASELDGRRGVIIAGRGCGHPNKIDAAARALGWPVFSEPRSGCGAGEHTILHFDALVRVPEIVDSLHPEVVLRLGEAPASKALAQWVTANADREIHVDGSGRIHDPNHGLDLRLEVEPNAFLDEMTRRLTPVQSEQWIAHWVAADLLVRKVLANSDSNNELGSGMSAARAVIQSLPVDSHLVVSSSMPIRDVEWFAGDCSHLMVHANRGANGIDGVIATAVGVARVTKTSTFVLLGDVAVIHDASTLLSLAAHDVDVRIVVINNDGGGIFHHLPQASTVDQPTFEVLYGTSHGLQFAQMARGLGIAHHSVRDRDDLRSAVNEPGPRVIEILTDRHRDLEAHKDFHERVAQALRTRGL